MELLELLGLWLGTFAASVCLELKNQFKIVRDAADRGYKLDLDQFSDLQGIPGLDNSKHIFYSLFIPVINVLNALKRGIKYRFMEERVFEELKKAGVLEKMTKEERQEYHKQPTAMNSFRMNVEQQGVVGSIEISSENGISKIYFLSNGTFEETQILKTTGPISELSLLEQKKKLREALESILCSGINQYGNLENFMGAARNTSYMDLRMKENSRKSQIQELEKMKSDLLGNVQPELPKQKIKGDKK